MSVLAKIGLLLLSTTSQSVALSPPNPPPSKHAQAKYQLNSIASAIGSIYIPTAFKTAVWSITLFQSYLTLFPSEVTQVGNYTINACNLQTVSKPFLCGCGLIAAGSFLRLYCYRAMGQFFTFQLALLPNHKLITSGPYALVRHPSYTAIILIAAGFPLVYMRSGSLLYEIYGRRLAQVSVALVVGLALALGRRANVEDRVLSKEFGKEWKDWAGLVRFKIFPGLF